MNDRLGAIGATLRRLLPVIVALVIVAVGFLWFVEPRITDMLRWQTEGRGLDNRVATLRASVDRASRMGGAATDEAMKQFEARTPTEDKVADVIELLAKRAQDPKAPGRLRGLLIEAGQRVGVGSAAAAAAAAAAAQGAPRVGGAPPESTGSLEKGDPRLALFGGPFDYTPVSLSFLSTFDRGGDFFWGCRS